MGQLNTVNLKDGEKIIEIDAWTGDEYNFDRLSLFVLKAIHDQNPIDMTAFKGIKILRFGWIEEPPPANTEDIHDPPPGKLWVVYKELSGTEKVAVKQDLEEEKQRTDVCRANLIRFLTHDQSPTRQRLAEVLRESADMIVTELNLDHLYERVSHGH